MCCCSYAQRTAFHSPAPHPPAPAFFSPYLSQYSLSFGSHGDCDKCSIHIWVLTLVYSQHLTGVSASVTGHSKVFISLQQGEEYRTVFLAFIENLVQIFQWFKDSIRIHSLSYLLNYQSKYWYPGNIVLLHACGPCPSSTSWALTLKPDALLCLLFGIMYLYLFLF